MDFQIRIIENKKQNLTNQKTLQERTKRIGLQQRQLKVRRASALPNPNAVERIIQRSGTRVFVNPLKFFTFKVMWIGWNYIAPLWAFLLVQEWADIGPSRDCYVFMCFIQWAKWPSGLPLFFSMIRLQIYILFQQQTESRNSNLSYISFYLLNQVSLLISTVTQFVYSKIL